MFAKDLKIGSMLYSEDRTYRVTRVTYGPIMYILAQRLFILGDYEVDFLFLPEDELSAS